MWIHFNWAIISIWCLINYSLTEGQHTHTHTPTLTHIHTHICMYSKHISRQQQEQRQRQQQQLKHICSISVWVLQNFRITKLPQFCRTPRRHLLLPLLLQLPLPLLVSQRKCLLVELHKKNNAERRQLRRQQQFQVLRQSPGWLSLWGVYVSARW